MSALVLDAGAFIAVDRDDRSMIARLRIAQIHGHELRTSAIVVAQVWRGPGGKQARLARLLRAVEVCPVDERMGRDAGVLLARAGTDDPIDAMVALIARSGDRILTRDPQDIGRLVSSSGKRVAVLPCRKISHPATTPSARIRPRARASTRKFPARTDAQAR